MFGNSVLEVRGGNSVPEVKNAALEVKIPFFGAKICSSGGSKCSSRHKKGPESRMGVLAPGISMDGWDSGLFPFSLFPASPGGCRIFGNPHFRAGGRPGSRGNSSPFHGIVGDFPTLASFSYGTRIPSSLNYQFILISHIHHSIRITGGKSPFSVNSQLFPVLAGRELPKSCRYSHGTSSSPSCRSSRLRPHSLNSTHGSASAAPRAGPGIPRGISVRRGFSPRFLPLGESHFRPWVCSSSPVTRGAISSWRPRFPGKSGSPDQPGGNPQRFRGSF